MGFVELLEGVFRGASSFLLPQLHLEWPLQDVSSDGMSERGSSGCPGLMDFLDGASRRRKGRRAKRKRREFPVGFPGIRLECLTRCWWEVGPQQEKAAMELDFPWIFPGTARWLSWTDCEEVVPTGEGSLQPWGCQGQWGGRGCAEQHHRHLSFSDLGSSEGPLPEAQPRECCTELLFLHLQFTPFQPSLGCLNVKTPASPSALLQPGRFRGGCELGSGSWSGLDT